MLEGLIFNQFHFLLEFTAGCPDIYYIQNTFRGALGYYLKKTFCISSRDSLCTECVLNQQCAYSYVFVTVAPPGRVVMKRYPYVPHPFTFHFVFKEKNLLLLNFIVIGRAIDYFPHIFLAIKSMGEKGFSPKKLSFSIQSIIDMHGEQLYSGTEETFVNKVKRYSVTNSMPARDRITIRLLTPLKLLKNNRVVRKIDLYLFLMSIIRRYSLLTYFHCHCVEDVNYSLIKENVKNTRLITGKTYFQHISRYSGRQDTTYNNGGILGYFVIGGDSMDVLFPFIKAGTYFHAGKATSFGHGKYCLEGEQE
ncbi:MAG: CRISPR system precrRNA processing endoribonuclease RAMP protein Cas6 [Spirochaetales bacterium]|nr:CRISPR system precrRNA processing endoribonuclease RAMP protein Cas6 [Spirochaetales bacterium]